MARPETESAAGAPGTAPRVLWQPDAEHVPATRMAAFTSWLDERGVHTEAYADLWRWSTTHIAEFWGALAEFSDVAFHEPPRTVLADREMPAARWFEGATLNYAEHALRPGPGKGDDDTAVVFRREDGLAQTLTYGELRRQVGSVRQGLIDLGVDRGDRVAAFAPNCPQTLVAFLATASLGAIWSSCSPDFGARAVLDRFAQIEPVVLFAVDGHLYNGRTHEAAETLQELRTRMSSLRATVLIDYLPGDARRTAAPPSDTPHPVLHFDRLAARTDLEPAYEPVPFDHPLWVLYSSGTTGLPKGIVQGHGGIVLEHLKELALHADLGPGERFFWFTTTGWMMWNYLISGLLVGCTLVLYDGSPAHPDLDALWQLAEDEQITYFGTSAPYIGSCLKQRLRPAEQHDLRRLRAIGSTGSPLTPEGFDWIADAVGAHVQTCSVSGGTDVCTAFLGSAPTVPVWEGELSCRHLGAAIAAYDEHGEAHVGQVGELVITEPMPSMPVQLWNDDDGTRMHEAYFSAYPGVWRHGDWVMITDRGSAILYGRSDSTLNRGGVRMGTSEFYRVMDEFDEVLDSLVIDTSGAGRSDGELLCFVVLAPGALLTEVEPRLRQALRASLSPRHVPDRFHVIEQVPRTLSGKKCEVPIKRILAGVPADTAVSRGALANPESLTVFEELARQRQ